MIFWKEDQGAVKALLSGPLAIDVTFITQINISTSMHPSYQIIKQICIKASKYLSIELINEMSLLFLKETSK